MIRHTALFGSTVLLAALLAVAALPGCGLPGEGILLTPVSTSRTLEETVTQRDSGLFVSDRIVIIEVDGVISNAETGPMFGQKENPVSLFVEKLDKAQADSNVKAVIIRINSPGGTVEASDIMHHHLLAFRTARPDVRVVASIQGIGASGGYYLACAAEKIYALPTSLTGSIGVIFETFSIQDMLGKIGVKTEPIKSGYNKDMASPFRDRNAEERKILQGLIDGYYEGFLQVVLDGRKDSAVKVTRERLLGPKGPMASQSDGEQPLADGRVFTGEQAKKLGLVNDLLYEPDVIAAVKKQAGIKRGKVVLYNRPLGYKGSIYAASGMGSPGGSSPSTVNLLNVDLGDVLERTQPAFKYLWTGPR